VALQHSSAQQCNITRKFQTPGSTTATDSLVVVFPGKLTLVFAGPPV